MRNAARVGYRWMRAFGLDPLKTASAFRHCTRYFRDRRRFVRGSGPGQLSLGSSYPILDEYGASAGSASGHYFHMDIWAARKIYEAAPERHLDIGSRVDGFIAHLLCFREVEVIDIRPLESDIEGLHFIQSDATNLDNIPGGSVESLSCLHAAEHFGLGRYGDPVDPLAYQKLLQAIERVLMPGGRLYFAVPIGRERVEFNAHRVFDPRRIVAGFGNLELRSFAAVDDAGDYIDSAKIDSFVQADLACGLFEFRKPVAAAGAGAD
jgi:SAM-dependent methyltransferase